MRTFRSFYNHCHFASLCFGRKTFFVSKNSIILFVFALSLFLTAGVVYAQMSELSDKDLSRITGQSGVSIMMDGLAKVQYDVIKFSDTEATPNWIEFRNVTVGNGAGGAYSFATYWNPTQGELEPNTLDVATTGSGQTLVVSKDTSQINPRWYGVGDFIFCNQSLGSLNLDAVSIGPTIQRYGAHADGTSGIDFDYATRAYTQAFRFTYNTVPETLTFSGIHLVGSATGSSDNPADPATWSFTGAGNFFRIGDIDNGNPAKIDVSMDTATGETSLVLNVPMEGSLRVENVAFGGNNFGPIAIDGIKVHRLTLSIR